MEPLSQALLGAAVAHVAAGREIGPRALAWGALVGMSPDIDVLFGGLHNGYGELLYHRGTTHSLWFGVVFGPILGWALWRWRDPKQDTPLRTWQWLCSLALVTHPLLDVFTPYGTQLFAPFWRARFAWHGVGIIDPLYTVPLGFAVAIAFGARRSRAVSHAACAIGLAITTGYLVAGVGLNEWARGDVTESLSVGDEASVEVYPTMLQPFLRRVTLREGERRFVGWHTTLASGCVHGTWFPDPPADARVDDLRRSWEGALFVWFALEDVLGHVDAIPGGGARVSLDDLRYGGLGTPPDRGMWGVEAHYGNDGVRASPVTRFRRPLGDRTGFDSLWEGTFGRFEGVVGTAFCRNEALARR